MLNPVLWRPAPYAPPLQQRSASHAIGQAPTSAPSISLVDSPGLALAIDLAAVTTSAYLAYGYGKVHSPMSTVFLLLATAIGVKALHDLSRMNA